MSSQQTALLFLRQDFRLLDNEALLSACTFSHLVPVFVCDQDLGGSWKRGEASRWWLHQSLNKFRETLRAKGSDLILLRGNPAEELPQFAQKIKASKVFWNRNYNPKEALMIKQLSAALQKAGIPFQAFSGNTLCEKQELLKKDDTPYLVYTPFWNNFLKKYQIKTLEAPTRIPPLPKEVQELGVDLEDLDLLPHINWYPKFAQYWKPGEEEALKTLDRFIKKKIANYGESRDLPGVAGTSQLSPYLHFGEVHPQRILARIEKAFGPLQSLGDLNHIQYCKEVVWREFAYHLLQHFPKTSSQSLKANFNNFPWRKNQKFYDLWCQGKTGYPIVDAGMRELWETGWMHNRVRMIVASFLIKHLNIPWQEGAKWFWDTLVDADLANNTSGWQWTAGCGADAAPYFRIFNPMTQGEKFDPDGTYLARWCPELKKLPAKWRYRPFEAPKNILQEAGVNLGDNYPHPIVDHKQAREKALYYYERLSNSSS